ncbi:MAG TPA: hypothetical protein VFG49_05255 [Dyella sp.]|uniref:hypothetical protein n=1 Tax=Dyella sp. TaxID=1869338 RepID=UPI002D793981|nr:hypothetical protein [Dyella sp.]HET6552929.1 hypothetical protein [Dyella sp.]
MGSTQRRERAWAAVVLFVVIALTGFRSTASERISFDKGADSTTFTAQLGEGHDYVLGARAGQTLVVTLKAPAGVYFNVLPPDGQDALTNTSITGDAQWSGALPRDGNYVVRVYQMRAASRQGKNPSFTITLAVK